MFQNMLMTGFTPLATKNELTCWDNRPFITKWPENPSKATKKEEITKTIKKKSKRNRTAFTTDQLLTLERAFAKYQYIDAKQREELASIMNIGERPIKIWFQNRRMKKKRASSDTESSNASPSPTVTSSTVDTAENFVPSGFEDILLVENVSNQIQKPMHNEPLQDNGYIFPQQVQQHPALYGFNGNRYQTGFYPMPTLGYYYPDGHQMRQCYEYTEPADWYDFDVNQFQNNGYSWQ